IGIPTVLADMPHDGLGECGSDVLFVTSHPVVVGGAEGHDIAVVCELMPTRQFPDVVRTLPFKGFGYLLCDDVAAEQSRERVADDPFEAAVESLDTVHCADASSPAHSHSRHHDPPTVVLSS